LPPALCTALATADALEPEAVTMAEAGASDAGADEAGAGAAAADDAGAAAADDEVGVDELELLHAATTSVPTINRPRAADVLSRMYFPLC
jgi:hypothetical protein